MSSAQKPQSEEHPLQSQVVDPLIEFSKDSVKLLNKCHRPDLKEFRQVAFATGVGLLVLGFLGFFVKLIHIPINDILVGSG